MVEEAGSQSASQDDEGHAHDEGHDEGQVAGSQLLLEVGLHSLSAWGPHDDDHEENGRECKLGGAPHTPLVVPDVSEGGCIHPVLVSVTGG